MENQSAVKNWELLISYLPFMVILLDENKIISNINKEAQSFFKKIFDFNTSDLLLDLSLAEFFLKLKSYSTFRKQDFKAFYSELEKVVNKEKELFTSEIMLDAAEKKIYLKLKIKSFAEGSIITFEDISERKEAEISLKKEIKNKMLAKIKENESSEEYEHKIINNNGELRYHKWKDYSLLSDNSQKRIYQSVGRDITEKKLETKFAEALFENSSSAIAMLDNNHQIMKVNNTFENKFGFKSEKILGINLDDLLEKNKAGISDRSLSKNVLKGEKVVSKGIRYDSAGKARSFLIKGIPIIIEADIKGVYVIYDDITEPEKTREELENTKKELENILESIEDGISVLNPDLTINYTNPKMQEWFAENRPLKGKKCYEVYHNSDQPCKKCPTIRSLESGNVESEIVRGLNGSGQKYLELFTYPILNNDNGEIEGVVEFVRDITEKKQLENKLKIKEEQYRKIFHESPIGMMLEDSEGNILEVNDSLCEVTGYKKEELINSSIFDKLVPPAQHQIARKNIKKILNNEDFEFITANEKPNGEKYHLKLKETKITLADKGEGILSMQLDITDSIKKEKKLKYLSYHDDLTGLYNRNFFEEELQRLDTKRQLPLALILVDANGLKLINDTYGHSSGDQFLIKIAEVLNSVMREEDIIARLGGDEFVAILPKTEQKEAQKIVNRILSKSREKYIEDINLSIGIGAAVKTDHRQNIYDILNQADKKMYQDKLTNGRSEKNKLIQNLLETLGAKSNESKEHAERMSELALQLGEALNLNNEDLKNLILLATIHDIGKVTIPEKTLKKTEALNRREWQEIKTHPEKGYRIAQATDEFSVIAKLILHHHERWDGSGYPAGLQAKEIPLLARIIAIIDAYDVMTNDRSYRKAISKEEAFAEIERCSGTQFDPELSRVFLQMMSKEI